MSGFLIGPSVHGTSKLRKHKLKRGLTRDLNAAAGAYVNTKSPTTQAGGFYGAAPKPVGPRFGKTVNPKRVKFGKKTPSKLLSRRRRR